MNFKMNPTTSAAYDYIKKIKESGSQSSWATSRWMEFDDIENISSLDSDSESSEDEEDYDDRVYDDNTLDVRPRTFPLS